MTTDGTPCTCPHSTIPIETSPEKNHIPQKASIIQQIPMNSPSPYGLSTHVESSPLIPQKSKSLLQKSQKKPYKMDIRML
jgi:hypothetical protein